MVRGFLWRLDGSGNVFVAGGTDCSGFATVAYSNAGVPLWTNHYGELGFFDQAPTAKV
jgi:cell wall-associated NlpC family hydrolase